MKRLEHLRRLALEATGPVALLESPLFSAILFEANPDALIVSDKTGTILLINTAAEEMFGYARAEIVGQPVITLIPQRYRDRHSAKQASYIADPSIRQFEELWALTKNGDEVPVSIQLVPVTIQTIVYIIAFIRERDGDADN